MWKPHSKKTKCSERHSNIKLVIRLNKTRRTNDGQGSHGTWNKNKSHARRKE